jgi:enterochelin esterase family protein
MRKTSLLAISMALSALMFAQAPPAPGRGGGRGGGGRAPAAPPAYVVNPDHTVTFRLRAPEATAVTVSGDFTQTAVAMTKAEDGVWSLTSAALRPAIYDYSFSVNGVRTNDPANPLIKSGDRSSSTMFEVKGDKSAPYDIQAVPHGTVRIDYYVSKKFDAPRMVWVYTPPGYEASTAVSGDVPAARRRRHRGGLGHRRARESDSG